MEAFRASKLFAVENMVAVITGAGSGLGESMAKALAANGAKVFILGRRLDALLKVASSASDETCSGSIVPVQCDITSQASLSAAVKAVSDQTRYIDVLIVNAGVSGPPLSFPMAPSGPSLSALRDDLWSICMEEFTATYHTNVTGTFYSCVAFLSLLDAANSKDIREGDSTKPRPHIICIGSIAGYAKGAASGYAYNSSKAAISQLMKQLSNLLVPYQIRVNTLALGIYLSPLTEGTTLTAMAVGDDPVCEGAYPKEMVPATRIGGDQDISGQILWLCSRAGSYTNGSVVLSDGGALAVRPSSY